MHRVNTLSVPCLSTSRAVDGANVSIDSVAENFDPIKR
jgi:hypothetical protein